MERINRLPKSELDLQEAVRTLHKFIHWTPQKAHISVAEGFCAIIGEVDVAYNGTNLFNFLPRLNVGFKVKNWDEEPYGTTFNSIKAMMREITVHAPVDEDVF